MANVDMGEALKLQNEYLAAGVLPEIALLLAKARLGDAEALAELEDLAAYIKQFDH
ncbi:hypothetical protein VIN30_06090 [Adlercreutzia sp. R7]|uniref:Uncharacterized protein n=1 Tax=Adlercreutzia wanghongyangiae TaxID=3111451 RepID=A0ABU6IHV2_9ACTN|nr:hypothetical protein [Adlercreutzia sp. R7]